MLILIFSAVIISFILLFINILALIFTNKSVGEVYKIDEENKIDKLNVVTSIIYIIMFIVGCWGTQWWSFQMHVGFARFFLTCQMIALFVSTGIAALHYPHKWQFFTVCLRRALVFDSIFIFTLFFI